MRLRTLLFAACILHLMWCANAESKSAMSPAHTGLEPPGEPRQLNMLPGRAPTRTPEGGMGYTDAYGNTIHNNQVEQAAPRRRLSPGAYGQYGAKPASPPVRAKSFDGKPVWNFHN